MKLTRACRNVSRLLSGGEVPARASDGVGRGGTHQKAEIAFREVDHGGVEVGALVEGGEDDGDGEGRRGLDIGDQVSDSSRTSKRDSQPREPYRTSGSAG